MLGALQYAGNDGAVSEESVDLDEVVERNKLKVQEQIKANISKQLNLVIQ